jgi:hypothetical protein
VSDLGGEGPGRVRWQVYRRGPAGLALGARHDEDRVWSEVLGCWLRSVLSPEDGRLRVRLATGPAGDELVPTTEEALVLEIEALRAKLAGG